MPAYSPVSSPLPQSVTQKAPSELKLKSTFICKSPGGFSN